MAPPPNASTALYNEDLAPAEHRNWGAFSIFNVWTSDVHSLWGYYLAASLFLLCGNLINFIIAIGIGSIVIFWLMSLVGYAGVRTGVPYPVLARASFGVFGANLPALVRAIVACFWYGAQTAAASGAIVALLIRWPAMLDFQQSSHMLGHSTLEVICFVVVWALQLLDHPAWHGDSAALPGLGGAGGLGDDAGPRGRADDHGRRHFIRRRHSARRAAGENTRRRGARQRRDRSPRWPRWRATWVTYFAALY